MTAGSSVDNMDETNNTVPQTNDRSPRGGSDVNSTV
jgi:hypothetical protein